MAATKSDNGITFLSKWEQWFYCTVHVLVVLYISSCVFVASNKYGPMLNKADFVKGWSFFDKAKDATDFEWLFIKQMIIELVPGFLLYSSLSFLFRKSKFEMKKNVLLAFSLALLTFMHGWRVVFLCLCQSCVMFFCTLAESVAAVWVISFFLLMNLNQQPFSDWLKYALREDTDYSYYKLVLVLSWLQLRLTSFALDKVYYMNMKSSQEEKDKSSVKYSFGNFLFYSFYTPILYTGPIISYNIFYKQIFNYSDRGLVLTNVICVFKKVAKVVFWTVVNDLILHYFYFRALQSNDNVMNSINLWTLAGLGYCSGQFFMTKYTVIYGVPSLLCDIDGVTAPKGPNCIAYIYLYSHMWKYFDRGMYDFLKRYIYIPLGGSQAGLGKKIFGSVACFSFVYYWHGAEYYVFLWTLFNFIGIFFEQIAFFVNKIPSVQSLQKRFLSQRGIIWFQTLIAVPLFVMSTFTAFCFFGGSSVGYIYYKRYITEGSVKSWTVLSGVLFFCILSSKVIQAHIKDFKDKK